MYPEPYRRQHPTGPHPGCADPKFLLFSVWMNLVPGKPAHEGYNIQIELIQGHNGIDY